MTSVRAERSQQRTAPPTWRQLAAGPAAFWVLLLILLAATCGSAFLPLGSYNAALNLMIAALMLFLLAAFLMNLREASALTRLVAAAGLFWVIFLFALTFTDYLSRRPTASPQPSHSAALRRHDSQEQLRDFDVFLSVNSCCQQQRRIS